MKAFQA